MLKYMFSLVAQDIIVYQLGHLDYQNIKKNYLNKNINLFCNDLKEQSNIEKEKVARKLHHQLIHPASAKSNGLLTDANIINIVIDTEIEIIDQLYEKCKIFQKFKKPKPKPIVGFPLTKRFHQTGAPDLKEWSSLPKCVSFI